MCILLLVRIHTCNHGNMSCSYGNAADWQLLKRVGGHRSVGMHLVNFEVRLLVRAHIIQAELVVSLNGKITVSLS